jgi:hypothetical protein
MKVTIDKEEYLRLRISDEKLGRLEAAGVDNWEGYGDALYPSDEVGFDEFTKALKAEFAEP